VLVGSCYNQELCLNGPDEKLQATLYSQPAILTVGVAAVAYMQEKYPTEFNKAAYAAGFRWAKQLINNRKRSWQSINGLFFSLSIKLF
jgi:hypothetical protein